MKKIATTAALLVAAAVAALAGGLAYSAAGTNPAGPRPQQTEPGPAAQAAAPPAKGKDADRFRGVVERAVSLGGEEALLTSGGMVAVDERTKYLIETGDGLKRGALPDVLGKKVEIVTKWKRGMAFAVVVKVLWPQVRAPAEPRIAWGEPHNGLRVGIGHGGPAPAGKVRLVLALENVGKEDLVLNLGAMLNNGRKQYPSALRLILTDAKEGTRSFRRPWHFLAGRLDPFVVPLPAGCRYSLRYDLADFTDEDGTRVGTPLAPGRYWTAVEFAGNAVLKGQTNADTTGIALMAYWTGTVHSGDVRLTLPAKGAAALPRFDAVVWVPAKGPNRGLLYLVLTEPRANNDRLDELVVRYAGAALREAEKHLPPGPRAGTDAAAGPGVPKGKEAGPGFNIVFFIRRSPRAAFGSATGFSVEQMREIRDANPERARQLARRHTWGLDKLPAAQ